MNNENLLSKTSGSTQKNPILPFRKISSSVHSAKTIVQKIFKEKNRDIQQFFTKGGDLPEDSKFRRG